VRPRFRTAIGLASLACGCAGLARAAAAAEPPAILVDRDDIEIRQTCTVRFVDGPILDRNGDGVVHVSGSGIVVEFGGGRLHGAAPGTAPDAYSGIGLLIEGDDVTVRGLRVSGFRGAIVARGAARVTIEDCDVSDNFRQRLGSTAAAEDGADWLWPHANDQRQWLQQYGAGVYLEGCVGGMVRRVQARRVQNGIVLDRVEGARILDNDCSFLSGWGLALWRSSDNLIVRNALDFCVRGYSHGVYNRGQDSAGILMFEQCCRNQIVENSATHGGDGFFGFAGREALGEQDPRGDLDWYRGRGNSDNLLLDNDFSYAAAHGIEMTFSEGNRFEGNRLVGNAICGIWGGYSRRSVIDGNVIEANGEMAYGMERGGVNIEHGSGNWIIRNRFRGNACGVHLWWDEDAGLLALPGVRVNGAACQGNHVVGNTFEGDRVGVQTRRCEASSILGNTMVNVEREIDADEAGGGGGGSGPVPAPVDRALMHEAHRWLEASGTHPVGARARLAGREHIVMTEWGPYDWESPLLRLEERAPGRHVYRMLGREPAIIECSVEAEGPVVVERGAEPGLLVVSTGVSGRLLPYTVRATCEGGEARAAGVLAPVSWVVRFFTSVVDPREDPAAWRRAGEAAGVDRVLGELELRYGMGGPPVEPPLTADHFGTLARATVALPAGRWRCRTVSDDGIRVWFGDELVIDDWTWHPPKLNDHEFRLEQPTTITVAVAHFELDGHAVLSLRFDPAP
jgi:parallel beta-helix repeat protein